MHLTARMQIIHLLLGSVSIQLHVHVCKMKKNALYKEDKEMQKTNK